MSKRKKRTIYPVTIFQIFMLFMFVIITTVFFFDVNSINELKTVYDNGQEVQATIVDVALPGPIVAPIYLEYEYVDEDGFIYTGYCTRYRFRTAAEAREHIGQEVTIKIYNQLSFCGDERPSFTQTLIAAILFTIASLILIFFLIMKVKKHITKAKQSKLVDFNTNE